MKFLSDLAKQLGVSQHAYVVGGAVRNFVMDPTGGKYPVKDIDVVIDSVALKGKDSEWFAAQVARAIPVRTNIATNQYGVALLHIVGDWMLGDQNLKGEDIEIANARTESYPEGGYTPDAVNKSTIHEDVVRREFTFNTLLWRLHDLAEGPDKAEILDLTGCGLRDLQEGVMRCPVSPDKTFSDDPSRMIRAIKFLIKYGFTLSLEVERSIVKNKDKIKNIPHAHLSNMLINTFLREPTGKKALLEMQKLGLLDVIKEIARTEKPFREALANWADKEAKVQFIFDLMDFELPSGKRLNFLTPGQQQQVREATVLMDHAQAEHYLQVLTQPGKVLDTKALMLEFNLQGAGVKQIQDVARGVLIATPALANDPTHLMVRVRMGLNPGIRVGKLLNTQPGESFGGGAVYLADVNQDEFIHFTTESRAQQIMADGKLLMHPPYKKFGIDAVSAVSIHWGKLVPGVQSTHIKVTPDDPLVAIKFKTSTVPSYGYVEEVIWDRDVILKGAKVIPAAAGVALIHGAKPLGGQDQVVYQANPKTAKTFTLNVGDPVLSGKFMNRPGTISGFGKNDKGDPTVVIDSVHGGPSKELKLFKVRYDESRAPEMPKVARRKLANPALPGEYHQRLLELRAKASESKERYLGNTPQLWVAWHLFYKVGKEWAAYVIDHLALPAKSAKAVEMAVRLFSKTYGMGKGPPDIVRWYGDNAERLYLLDAAREWPERSEESGIFQLGPFTVHDTIQASPKDLANAKVIIERAVKASTNVPGLHQMAYGQLFLVGQLGRKNWAAWYMPAKDVIYLRPGVQGSSVDESARHLVHELGHRLWAKKLDQATKQKWNTYHFQMTASKPDSRLPEVGEVLAMIVNNKKVKVDSYDDRGQAVLVEATTGAPVGTVDRMRIRQWIQEADHKGKFPSLYAATDADEHFCESLSLYAMGRLTGPNLDAFDEIVLGLPVGASARLASRYQAARTRTACIIAVGEFDEKRCLLKNRDRNYNPQIEIVHELINGVEVAYFHDMGTDWSEGINEHGVGIVNSALMVLRDEGENNRVLTKGKPTRDGERIREALSKKTVREATEVICTHINGLKGHTLVADADSTKVVEASKKYEPIVTPLRKGVTHVRTNHGILHPEVGYTRDMPIPYVSTHARRDEAESVLRGVTKPTDMAQALVWERLDDRKSPYNMVRDTDDMFTSSQMVLNLTDLEMHVYIIPGKAIYKGITNKLPEGYKPKINVSVYRYGDMKKDEPKAKPVKQARSMSLASLLALKFLAKQGRETFGPRTPLMDVKDIKVTYRIKASSSGILAAVYSGATRIAAMDAYSAGNVHEAKCASDILKLLGQHPELEDTSKPRWVDGSGRGHPRIEQLSVSHADVYDESLRGLGIGKAMYLSVAAEWFDRKGPFLFMSDDCGSVGSTSAAAKRVWESLAKQYPSSGRVIAILRRPILPTQMKAAFRQEWTDRQIPDVGDKYAWETVGGNYYQGTVTEVDSNVLAVACTDGTTRMVEAAKYQKKKEVPKADGKGTTTVYEYSEKQIQNRNRDKAERVEKLRGNLHKLQDQVTKDLKSKDTHTRLCALAVGLMNDTYERVGNDESAKDGHVGVTGWTPEHIKFGDGKATITYVGKSGVDHEKVTKDAELIRVMKEAVKDKQKGDTIFTYEDGRVNATAVNEYLDGLGLGITAKDIRGLHANREMQERLKAARSKGGNLPEDKKEREKKLKDEFTKALEGAAEAVGHEAATLKSQYLVPGLEDAYLKDGTVLTKLDEKKASIEDAIIRRVAARYLATKTPAQKEDKDVRQMLKPDPKKKPIREDLRRNRMRTEDADLAGEGDKDLSLNFKKVAARVAWRWMLAVNKRQQKKNDRKQGLPSPPKPPAPPALPKPPAAKPGEPEHKPGDVWQSENKNWVAKNPEGEPHTFGPDKADKEKATAYSKGQEIGDEGTEGTGDGGKAPDYSKALGAMADALSAGAPKKINQARKELLEAHPELEEALKEPMAAYDAANKELAKASIRAEGLKGKAKAEADQAATAAADKRDAAVEQIKSLAQPGAAEKPKDDAVPKDDATPVPTPKDEGKPEAAEKPEGGSQPDEGEAEPVDVSEPEAEDKPEKAPKPKADPLGGKPLSKTPLDGPALLARAEGAFQQFRRGSAKARAEAAEEAATRLENLEPDSPQAKELNRIIDGLHLAMEMNGEKWEQTGPDGKTLLREPLDEKMGILARHMVKQGDTGLLLADSSDPHAVRESVRDAMGKLGDGELQEMSKDTPWAPLADLLNGVDGVSLDPAVQELLRGLIRDMGTNNMTTNRGLINAIAGKKMPASNPIDVFDEVGQKFQPQNLQEGIADLVECLKKAQDPQSCSEMSDQIKLMQVTDMATALDKATEEMGVEVDPQNPHVAAVRYAVKTGDLSILDEPLQKAEPPHPPGTVWANEDGDWVATNPEGVAHIFGGDFVDKYDAEAYAKGEAEAPQNQATPSSKQAVQRFLR